MNLVEFAVRRHRFTLVVFVMLAALGLSSLLAIPKAEDPTFPFPNFAIVAVYPGAAPNDIETLVVDPLETKLKALDDVKTMKTEISDGLAVVQVEFTAGIDPDKKYDDVLREVNSQRTTLPQGVQSVEVKRFNATNVAILQVALMSEAAPYRELEARADRLKRSFEATPGVKTVEKNALPAQEVRVALDLERLAARGIAPLQVVGAIQATNVNVPGGSIDEGARKLNVKTSGDYTSIEQVKQTVVAGDADGMVHLEDVADVALRDADANYVGRFNGHRAVFVTATMKEGQDIFAVQAALKDRLATFAKELPGGIAAETVFDQSSNVRHRLTGFSRDFLIAIGLVLITLLPLGLRASLIVMISIPLSLAIGLSLLRFAGYSINQLSIVGFVIALGLLVDDSIVVVENIARFLREGHSRRDAAISGTKQIAVSVLGCTATLVFAFLPVLFLPGTPGQFIRSLPLAVVFTVLASLLVALTIIPFLAGRLLKEEGTHGNVFLRAFNGGIEAVYRPVLHAALRRPKTTVLAAAALFVTSVAIIPRVGFSLFPKAGTPQFLIKVETPDGASLRETDRATRFVEQVLGRHPEVASFATNVGQGNPQIYYNVAPKNQQSNVAEIFAQLRDFEPSRSPGELEAIRKELRGFAGAKIELTEFENGPPLDAPIAIRVIGPEFASLEAIAAKVEEALRQTPGTRDVDNPSRQRKTDLRVDIDRARAGSFGVQLADVDKLVRMGVTGIVAGSYHETSGEFASTDARDINVTLARDDAHARLTSLDKIYIPTSLGAQIPLSQVATIMLEPSPTTIRHFDKERSVTVTSFVAPGFNTDRVTKEVLSRLASLDRPAGYRLVAAGEIESRQESFGGMGTAILVATFGILAILVLEFRTFRSTMIVASVIPLGIIGGVAALFLTHNTLSFTASIGFIALIGIEVKNSILLVDFTNHLRAQGMPIDEAIERAGETRFLPILLTTLTALGGLVPLALEQSPLYSPLAWVIIGGLITSTVLTRVVTPVVYKLLAPALDDDDRPSDLGVEATSDHATDPA